MKANTFEYMMFLGYGNSFNDLFPQAPLVAFQLAVVHITS